MQGSMDTGLSSTLDLPHSLGLDINLATMNLLISQHPKQWNLPYIQELIDPLVIASIFKISISVEPTQISGFGGRKKWNFLC